MLIMSRDQGSSSAGVSAVPRSSSGFDAHSPHRRRLMQHDPRSLHTLHETI